MHELYLTGIFLFVLFLLLGTGVWIGLALLGVAWVGMTLFTSSPAGDAMITTIWTASSSWALSALPLFIWTGEILFRTRLSEDMFRGLSPWMANLPGRLLHTNIVGCTVFAAVSGSSAATVVTVGKMSIPELRRRGYPERMIVGSLAGAGTLGLMIPPSLILIVYGVTINELISKLFIAGVFPGLVLAGLFMGYVTFWSLLRADLVPPEPTMSLRAKLEHSRFLIPVVCLILAVLGSIYLGFATATEAAAFGVIGALLLALAQGSLTWESFITSLMGATRTSCMIALILAGAAFLALAMGFTGLPRALAAVDRRARAQPAHADRGADRVLHHPRLLSRRHQRRGADHGRGRADDPSGRHRPHLVRHLHRGGGRDGADHPAGRLQPVRPARHDRPRDQLHRADRAAVLFPDVR